MTSKLSIGNPLLLTIAVFSSLFGFSGLEHGFFEILQGSSAPNSLMISAIGPLQRFWLHGTETAFTLIPNFLVTGIVTVIISICVIIWSIVFLKNKHSWIILLVLSIAQFLTGGGFAQIFLSVFVSIAASGLYRPRKLWQKYLSKEARRVIAMPWIILFISFIVIFIASIEMAVFGFPYGISNPEITYSLMKIASYVMIIIFFLSIVTAFAKESLKTESI